MLWSFFVQAMVGFNHWTLSVALSRGFLRFMGFFPTFTLIWIYMRFIINGYECGGESLPLCRWSISAMLSYTESETLTVAFVVSTYIFTLCQLLWRFWLWCSSHPTRRKLALVLFSIRFFEALDLIGVLAYEINLYRDYPATEHTLFAGGYFVSAFVGTFWEYSTGANKHRYLYESMIATGLGVCAFFLMAFIDSTSVVFGITELVIILIIGVKTMFELDHVNMVEKIME